MLSLICSPINTTHKHTQYQFGMMCFFILHLTSHMWNIISIPRIFRSRKRKLRFSTHFPSMCFVSVVLLFIIGCKCVGIVNFIGEKTKNKWNKPMNKQQLRKMEIKICEFFFPNIIHIIAPRHTSTGEHTGQI